MICEQAVGVLGVAVAVTSLLSSAVLTDDLTGELSLTVSMETYSCHCHRLLLGCLLYMTLT